MSSEKNEFEMKTCTYVL